MRAALRAQSFLFNGAAACVHNADNRELDAILEYLKQLKGRCVAKAETYGERKARRSAELAGLKQVMLPFWEALFHHALAKLAAN